MLAGFPEQQSINWEMIAMRKLAILFGGAALLAACSDNAPPPPPPPVRRST